MCAIFTAHERRPTLGKTNWMRVFLGGLLAGATLLVLGIASSALYLKKLLAPTLAALNPAFQETTGFKIFWIVIYLITGIVAVWLYSAIRPRYGAGPKTALLVGIAFWFLSAVWCAAMLGSYTQMPLNLLFVDAITRLVVYVVGTLVGAWAYREQSQQGS
jgi:hypothetical protein